MSATSSRSSRPGRALMRSPLGFVAASSTEAARVHEEGRPPDGRPSPLLQRVIHFCGERPSKGGRASVENPINYASGLPTGEAARDLGGLHQLCELDHGVPPYG